MAIEGSLACHTYCDMGHPFIMVISVDPRHSHLLPNVWQWSCNYLSLQLRYVAAGILTTNLLRAEKFFVRNSSLNSECHTRNIKITRKKGLTVGVGRGGVGYVKHYLVWLFCILYHILMYCIRMETSRLPTKSYNIWGVTKFFYFCQTIYFFFG